MTLWKPFLAASLVLATAPALAQAPATPPAEPAAAAQPAATQPAAVAQPAPAPEKLTVDFSGFLVLNAFYDRGALNSTDLPRWATGQVGTTFPSEERMAGVNARQSRFRANVGIPTDGLLGSAKLKGFVEIDFAAGNFGDPSLPVPRLRHAWVSATWKDLGNLTVMAGQGWGLLQGETFASSLSHLVVPRFGGAGRLFRRAPQLRISGDLGGDLAVGYAVAALAPMDRDTANLSGNPGERSAMPNAEGRVALMYRPKAGPVKAELAASAHVGKEKYELPLATTPGSKKVTSQAVALDAKLDLPFVTILGGAFTGQDLDVNYSFAPGVVATYTGTPGATTASGVKPVHTKGLFVQGIVTPVKGLQLLAGYGAERPDRGDLAPNTAWSNTQASGGVLLNLSSKLRTGVEFTRYWTKTASASDSKISLEANQVEVSTMLTF